MATRSSSSQVQHRDLIQVVRDLLLRDGWTEVLTDHIGGTPPRSLQRGPVTHVPDLTATSPDGVPCVMEAETGDSIDDEHTAGQWTAFAQYAAQLHGSFIVLVPRGHKDSAEQRMRALKLPGAVWEFKA